MTEPVLIKQGARAMKDEMEEVGRNEICSFHRNDTTRSVDGWANGWGLLTVRCLLAIQNADPNDVEYVLVEDGEVLAATKRLEDVAAKVDMVAISRGLKRR